MFGLVASGAHAGTIDLLCLRNGGNAAFGLNVSIDLTADTAVVWGTGTSRQNQPVSRATITPDQVTWGPVVVNSPAYTLDRNSGALNISSPNQMGGPFAAVETLNCRKATPVF